MSDDAMDPVEDQIAASVAETKRLVSKRLGITRTVRTEDMPPAVIKLVEGYERANRACDHVNASAQPEFWSPRVPDLVVCRRCIPILTALIVDSTAHLPIPCDGCGCGENASGHHFDMSYGRGIIQAFLCGRCKWWQHPSGK